jgi:hypothetical protein
MSKFNDASHDEPLSEAAAVGAGARDATEQPSAGDARRAALRKIGKFSAYAAPAMLAVASGSAAATNCSNC